MTNSNSNTDIDEEIEIVEPLFRDEPNEEPDDEAEASSSLPSFSRLILLARPEFGILAASAFLMILSQIGSVYTPLLVGRAYDVLWDPEEEEGPTDPSRVMPRIHRLMALALVVHFGGSVAGSLRSTLMGIAGERIVARMRTTLYASILRQEIAFFDTTQSGELVSRLGSDTMVVKRAIASSWAEVALGGLRLVAILGTMCFISPKLAGWTVGSTFLVFVVCLPFGKLLGRLSKEHQEVLGAAQNFPTETITSMRTVKAFCAELQESERYARKIGGPNGGGCCWGLLSSGKEEPPTTFSIGCKQSIVRAAFGLVIFGGGFGCIYGTLWYGLYLVHANELTMGGLTSFQIYILGIGGILAHVSSSISNLIEARHASQRIFSLLDRKPLIEDPHGSNSGSSSSNETREQQPSLGPGLATAAAETTSLGASKAGGGMVVFENVSFSYPSRPELPVLRNFNLTIAAGKTTAIVGPSGAGKSTIISLLERFYDVSSGTIRCDGMNIRDMRSNHLRQKLGYVQQEPNLFGLSIRENLCYGGDTTDNEYSDDELWEACRTANADKFVARLPHGLDELVGERGIQLSGGQKQRLAIARAVLGKPQILLLDEATSALDAESEFLVREAMAKVAIGRTVVVVAHRLSTIQMADTIVVVEDHELRDAGTHRELLERCPTYQNLIARQSVVAAEAAAAAATTTTTD